MIRKTDTCSLRWRLQLRVISFCREKFSLQTLELCRYCDCKVDVEGKEEEKERG